MSRLMSVAFTEQAVVERRKTVTRRKGWWEDKNGRRILKPGDRLTLCRKVMGRKKGEPLVRVADVEVVAVRRELLSSMLMDLTYGQHEVEREGFPGMDPEEFVRRYFIDAQHMFLDDCVTRIEWRYLGQPELLTCSGCGEPYDATDPDVAGTCVHDNLCRRCWAACDRGRSCRDGCHERGER